MYFLFPLGVHLKSIFIGVGRIRLLIQALLFVWMQDTQQRSLFAERAAGLVRLSKPPPSLVCLYTFHCLQCWAGAMPLTSCHQ